MFQNGVETTKNMEKEYKVKSERYGYVHKFVQMPSGYYSFVPEKNWMPVYITGKAPDIAFIDTEGGPCIGVGFETNEVKVKKIHCLGLSIEFELEEKKTEE